MDDASRPAPEERAARATEDQAARARVAFRRVAAVTGGSAVALWLGNQRSFTWQSYLGVAAVSGWYLARAAFGRPDRVRPPRRLHPVGLLSWSAVVLAFSALEVVDDRLGSTPAHPTLSSAMDPVLEHPLLRAAAVGLWILAGRELVRR